MLRYECDCCGACCRGHLIVEADALDLLREPQLAEADPYYRGQPIEAVLAMLDEPGRCLVLAASRACIFLDGTNRCSIHPTRPNDCVAMQPGDEQCQYARAAAGLTPLLPSE